MSAVHAHYSSKYYGLVICPIGSDIVLRSIAYNENGIRQKYDHELSRDMIIMYCEHCARVLCQSYKKTLPEQLHQ